MVQVQDKTREALQNTMLVMNETKNIAVNAAEQLNAQTDQIGKMGTNLKAIDEELMTSDKVWALFLCLQLLQLLKDFAVRMMTDKLIMFFVAIIVIGVIAAVIVYVIFRDSDERIWLFWCLILQLRFLLLLHLRFIITSIKFEIYDLIKCVLAILFVFYLFVSSMIDSQLFVLFLKN